jgi:dihydrodipicolinate synthase/N-acetylneuraminate lyase
MLSIKRVDWGPLEQMNSRLLREPVSGLIILCTNGELANLMKVYAGAPGSERNE